MTFEEYLKDSEAGKLKSLVLAVTGIASRDSNGIVGITQWLTLAPTDSKEMFNRSRLETFEEWKARKEADGTN